jgi:hypothetical protein
MQTTNKKTILLLASTAALVWIAGAAIDAFVLGQGSFMDLVLNDVPLHEVSFRLFFILVYSALTFRSASASPRSAHFRRTWTAS